MAVWKCFTRELGALFVTISSTKERQRLRALSWAEKEDLSGTAERYQTEKDKFGWTTRDALDMNCVWTSVLSAVSTTLISGENTTAATKKMWECAAEDRPAQPSRTHHQAYVWSTKKSQRSLSRPLRSMALSSSMALSANSNYTTTISGTESALKGSQTTWLASHASHSD